VPASKPGRPLEIAVLLHSVYGTHQVGSFPPEFKDESMTPTRIFAIVLIVAGVAALAYGGFSYTRETHKAEIGPLKFSLREKEQVNVPQWAGIGAIAAGVVLLLAGGRKK
jgi:multidrug transporter EmrE-like cation transporter